MQKAANIVLVGFMGTGKTTVGHALAQQLGMTFVDMDDMIVSRQGKSIPDIFAQDGEPRFRALERELAGELAGREGLVVGTGGGIVLNAGNIADFSRTGLVVCLSAAPQTILARLESDTSRPLLAEGDKMAKITGILDQRQALYDAIPHQVPTDDLSVDQVVSQITGLYTGKA
jgi:shikimate kinase